MEIVEIQKNHGKTWTLSDDRKLRALRKEGNSFKTIAELLGRTNASVIYRYSHLAPEIPEPRKVAKKKVKKTVTKNTVVFSLDGHKFEFPKGTEVAIQGVKISF